MFEDAALNWGGLGGGGWQVFYKVLQTERKHIDVNKCVSPW